MLIARNSRILRIILFIFALAVFCPFTSGKIIYVDDDATGLNNGTNWQNAYVYLQDALADAETAEKPLEIRVAQGNYTPDKGANQTPGDREATFHLVGDVIISGGYAGIDANDPNVRDIELYQTILSGDLNGDDVDVENAQSLLEHVSRQDNSNHICYVYSTDSKAFIDGLYIIGGNAFGYGGGIMWALADLNILNCTFKDNTASEQGGAIYNRHLGGLIITNCTFIRNASQNRGGAISNGGGNPTMSGCIFRENYASSSGGALYNTSGVPQLIGCIFEHNSSYRGAGIYNNGDISLTNCTFTSNNAEGFGGGIYNFEGTGEQFVVTCNFKDNYAGTYGGGIFNNGNENVFIKNCLFVNNSSRSWGGAIHFWRSAGEILNCTIANNSAGRGGGLCCGYEEQTVTSNVKITNSILWGNSEQIYNDNDSEITITYSCIEDLFWGRGGPPKGTIKLDPCFVEAGYWANINDPNIVVGPNDPNAVWIEGDYHLKSQAGRFDPNSGSWVIDLVSSPCIDAGDPNTPVGDEPELNGRRINMGAYGGTIEASKSLLSRPF
ncbi:MAG: hypothetical protein JW715_09850 [Sedimentisphaerales bacterium]|nr:hypothetical protein [Sedimentisphaerales bacterium]